MLMAGAYAMTAEQFIVEEYISFRMQPTNDDTSDSIFCTKHNIALKTLKKILQETKTDYKSKIVDERRATYKHRMLEVDDALFKRAKAGDVRAAELLYKRWDGWSDKLIDQSTHYHYDFVGLVKLAEKSKRERNNIPNRPL
jgi:hypothetical protein